MDKVKLAREIRIDWNPVTDNGSVSLNVFEHIIENEKVTSFLSPVSKELIFHNFTEIRDLIVDQEIIDPVTGIKIENFSGAGVILMMKRLTDEIFKKRDEMIEAQRLIDEAEQSE
jgi:hypothetical protein